MGHRLMEACKGMERSERRKRVGEEEEEEGSKGICLMGRNIRVDYWCLICLMTPPPLLHASRD
jgi:hypothetical protein